MARLGKLRGAPRALGSIVRRMSGPARRVMGTILVTALVVAFAGIFVLRAHPGSASPSAAPTATVGQFADEATPTATDTPLPTATATSAPTATPGDQTPPAGNGFYVTKVMLAAAPSGEKGSCGPIPMPPFRFPTVLNLSAGHPSGTVSYRYIRSDGTISDTRTITVPSGEKSPEIDDYPYTIPPLQGDGSPHWIQMEVLSPNHLLSDRANVAMTCTPSVYDTSAVISPSALYDCTTGGTQTFIFEGTVSVAPMPDNQTITYYWIAPDGTKTSQLTTTVPPGATSGQVQPYILTLTSASARGGYAARFVVTSPNPLDSDTVTAGKPCLPS